MNGQGQTKFDDPEIQREYDALVRAGRRARQVARETRTGIVVMENGVIREIPWTELPEEESEES